ncbi:MAG: hypothetical protein ACRDPC_26520 [Solirubrobacteraceae bacterium]
MSLHRGIDGSDPVRPDPVSRLHEERRRRAGQLATGTLACPVCDAPVAPDGAMTPAEPLACPYCRHAAAVRDFLSIDGPSRPARVEVRVVPPA